MQASTYSALETLRDGSRVEIRAVRPADRDALLGTVARMSDETIRRRYFASKRHFTEREIEFYTDVDFVTHVALAAVLNGEGPATVVGGGRYVLTRPDAAEVAFAVEDAHQGRGIGSLLMRHLAAIARESGLRELIAEVLPSNMTMLAVFQKSGLAMRTKREDGVVLVTLVVA